MSTRTRGILRRRLPRVLSVVAGLALLTAGCGRDAALEPSTPPANDPRVDVNQPLGGVTFDDEEPGFGDATLEAEAAAEVATQDPMTERLDLESLGGPEGGWALTVTWGVLSRPGSALEEGGGRDSSGTDWSGSIVVDPGSVLVRRVVAFEEGDHVVRPRTDRSTLAWVSHTRDGFDGLRLGIRSAEPGVSGAGTVTWSTGPYAHTFAMSELDSLDLLVDLADGSGNQVHFRSFKIRPGAEAGFLAGIWGRAAEDSLGHFRGRLVDERGRVVGSLRGAWGEDSTGAKVLFGKVIDRGGRFRAVIAGTWLPDDADPASGTFHADFLAGSRSEPIRAGGATGRWSQEPTGRGTFDGIWCLGCP